MLFFTYPRRKKGEDSPTKSCLHPAKIMLLEFATFFLIMQVFSPEPKVLTIEKSERDRYLALEPSVCPICRSPLQGHGWRCRYVAIVGGWLLIMVHRKRCPACKMTFTLLPKGVHALRLYDVQTIVATISSYLETGRYLNSIPLSKSLRKQWVKAFLRRNADEGCKDNKQLLKILEQTANAFLAAPLALKRLTQSDIFTRQNLERYKVPHQRLRLGLCIPSG